MATGVKPLPVYASNSDRLSHLPSTPSTCTAALPFSCEVATRGVLVWSITHSHVRPGRWKLTVWPVFVFRRSTFWASNS